MAPANGRDSILESAARLVARDGVKHLTIEQVAKEAGLSRGGVLYHFPSKETLIEAMVTQLVDGFEYALEAEMAQDSEPHGRLTRAYARLTLQPDAEIAPVISALLAGLAFYPNALAPLHAKLAEWQQRSAAELDPTVAAIVRLTTHALWTNDLFLTNTFSGEERRAIVAQLEAMTRKP